MSIGERIKKRREEMGLSQAELAKRIGVTQGSIGNYENGVSNPKMELMPKLFEALNTDANYLFEGAASAQGLDLTYSEAVMVKKHRALDTYGKKAVNDLLETEYTRSQETAAAHPKGIIKKIALLAASAGTGDFLDGDEFERIALVDTPEAERADFAVRVNGDSMEPTYYDDDILLVDATRRVGRGDVGVFVVNGSGYVKEFGGDRLISHNKKYDDILLHEFDSFTCSGLVIGTAEEIK